MDFNKLGNIEHNERVARHTKRHNVPVEPRFSLKPFVAKVKASVNSLRNAVPQRKSEPAKRATSTGEHAAVNI